MKKNRAIILASGCLYLAALFLFPKAVMAAGRSQAFAPGLQDASYSLAEPMEDLSTGVFRQGISRSEDFSSARRAMRKEMGTGALASFSRQISRELEKLSSRQEAEEGEEELFLRFSRVSGMLGSFLDLGDLHGREDGDLCLLSAHPSYEAAEKNGISVILRVYVDRKRGKVVYRWLLYDQEGSFLLDSNALRTEPPGEGHGFLYSGEAFGAPFDYLAGKYTNQLTEGKDYEISENAKKNGVLTLYRGTFLSHPVQRQFHFVSGVYGLVYGADVVKEAGDSREKYQEILSEMIRVYGPSDLEIPLRKEPAGGIYYGACAWGKPFREAILCITLQKVGSSSYIVIYTLQPGMSIAELEEYWEVPETQTEADQKSETEPESEILWEVPEIETEAERFAIASTNVNLRALPDTASERLMTVGGGTSVLLAGPEKDGWYRAYVRDSSGKDLEGWIKGDYLEIGEISAFERSTEKDYAPGSGVELSTFLKRYNSAYGAYCVLLSSSGEGDLSQYREIEAKDLSKRSLNLGDEAELWLDIREDRIVQASLRTMSLPDSYNYNFYKCAAFLYAMNGEIKKLEEAVSLLGELSKEESKEGESSSEWGAFSFEMESAGSFRIIRAEAL